MNILFIDNGIVGEQPFLTGGETRFIEIARCWARQGHRIHLMSSQSGKELCRRLNLEVIFHNFSNSKRTSNFVFIFRALKSLLFLPKSLAGFKQGIVYSANNMIYDVLPALRLKIRGRKKIKWVGTAHIIPLFPPWKRKGSAFLSSILFFINERASIWLTNRFADVLLPISRMTAARLSDIGVNMHKVYPVECGVDYPRIRSIAQDVKKKRYDAVFMKRLQAVKGAFDLIEIWDMVVQAKPNAQLLIIGEGGDSVKVKKMVRQKGLDKNIEFSGMIYDLREKITRLAESRICLSPSYEENWSIAIGEALAAGTPVISYQLKELLNVWQDSIIQVAIGDKQAFAKKIIYLIDNPAFLAQLSARGIEYMTRYNWQDLAEKELKIILGDGDESFESDNQKRL